MFFAIGVPIAIKIRLFISQNFQRSRFDEIMSIMAAQKRDRFVTSVTPQVAPQVTPQDRIVEFCSIPRSKDEITQFLGLKDKKSVSERYIKPLIVENRLAMTLPNTPTSRNQRYVAVKGMSMD